MTLTYQFKSKGFTVKLQPHYCHFGNFMLAKKVHCPLSIKSWWIKQHSHRSHFQTKQLYVEQNNFDGVTWNRICEIFATKKSSIVNRVVMHTASFTQKSFQTKQLSVGQHGEFAWQTWTWCRICLEKSFALTGNSRLRRFLLKWADFACENVTEQL